jgi:hypothetical protein
MNRIKALAGAVAVLTLGAAPAFAELPPQLEAIHWVAGGKCLVARGQDGITEESMNQALAVKAQEIGLDPALLADLGTLMVASRLAKAFGKDCKSTPTQADWENAFRDAGLSADSMACISKMMRTGGPFSICNEPSWPVYPQRPRPF